MGNAEYMGITQTSIRSNPIQSNLIQSTTIMTNMTDIPEPDEVVFYGSNSTLFLYGNRESPTMTLLCAGFADDHTVFQPFAKELSKKGVLTGVMIIPRLGQHKEHLLRQHKIDETTIDQLCDCVRQGATALKESSENEKVELIGIYHDWSINLGSSWWSRIEQNCLNGVMDSLQTGNFIEAEKTIVA